MKYHEAIDAILADACHNRECPFLHIDPEAKVQRCLDWPWPET